MEVSNRSLKYGVQCCSHDDLSWQKGIEQLLKTFCATAAKPGQESLAERFLGRKVRLDFQPVLQQRPSLKATRHVLIQGPFDVDDLVLTRHPQTPKGCSPYAGPFRVVEVVGRYTYLLSDGQKWNVQRLKCFLPPADNTPHEMTRPCVNAKFLRPQLPASDEVDWTSTPGAPVPVGGGGAVVEEADAHAEDVGPVEHELVVRPKLGKVVGPAGVEDELKEHFETPPAVPHYPTHEWKKPDRLKPRDWR